MENEGNDKKRIFGERTCMGRNHEEEDSKRDRRRDQSDSPPP